jgi:hypothetical protein
MLSLTKDKSGNALVLTILVMAVLSVLGISLLGISLSDTKHAIYQERKIQANYLARAGADDLANKIISTEALPVPSLVGESQVFDDQMKYTIEKIDPLTVTGWNGYNISAVGEVNGVRSRVGLTVAKDKPSSVLNHAIYTYDDLNISNLKVYGQVGSLGDVTYDPHKYDTAAYGEPQEGIEKSEKYDELPVEIPDLELKTITGYTGSTLLETNKKYSSISPTSDCDVIFNTGSSSDTKSVVIESGLINNSNEMYVIGDGLLKMYIKSFEFKGNLVVDSSSELEIFVDEGCSLKFQTPLTANDNNPNKIRIYLGKDSVLYLQADGTYNCYIIGPEATVQMNSNQTTVNGSIIGKLMRKTDNGENNYANGVVNFINPDDTWDLVNAAYNKRFYEN